MHDVMQASKDVCDKLDLDGLVVIGGDDSNTNGAVLAEYFEAHGCKTKVRTRDMQLVCVPHLFLLVMVTHTLCGLPGVHLIG